MASIEDRREECVLSEAVLYIVSQEIGPEWRILGRLLNVSVSVMRNIDADERQVSEKAYQAMRSWIQSMENASDRLAVLCNVLAMMNRKDIVAKLLEQSGVAYYDQLLSHDCRIRLGEVISKLAPSAFRSLIKLFDVPDGQSYERWIYNKISEQRFRLSSPIADRVPLRDYYLEVLYPWEDGYQPASDCEIWCNLTGNFNVKVYRYLIMQLDLIKEWHAGVEDMYQFRKRFLRLGPRPLSAKECNDLWDWLRKIFSKLGFSLERMISTMLGGGGLARGERVLADNYWYRLAAIVHYHLPNAALQLCKSKVFCEPALKEDEFNLKLGFALEEHKEGLLEKLAQWERDIVYPQSAAVNTADFSIGLWRKVIQHFCPDANVFQVSSYPTIDDIAKYFSDESSPGNLVEGLYQYGHLIIDMGSKVMEEKKFKVLWEFLERMLTVVQYDVAQISAYYSSDFDLHILKSLTNEPSKRVRAMDDKASPGKFAWEGEDSATREWPVTDNYWFRLAAVVHYHLPYAALQLLENKVLATSTTDVEGFMAKLFSALEEHKEALFDKLSPWERDIVYPQSKLVSTSDFSIAVWRKLTRHLCPNEELPHLQGVPTINRIERYFSKDAGPACLVEGLYQFRSLIFRIGSKEMDETEFNRLWEVLERILTVVEYDLAKIANYKTADFDFSCPESVAEKLPEGDARETSVDEEEACKNTITEVAAKDESDIRLEGELDLLKLGSDSQIATTIETYNPETLNKTTKVAAKYESGIQGELDLPKLDSDSQIAKTIEPYHPESLRGSMAEVAGKYESDTQSELFMPKLGRDSQIAKTIESYSGGRMQCAQDACLSAIDSLLSSVELDVFGEQINVERKVDMAGSLLQLDKFRDRRYLWSEQEDLLNRSHRFSRTIETRDIFKKETIALVSGYAGVGKTTLCRSILREWRAGRLWSDKFDFVFYVNAPLLVTSLKEGPYNEEAVLRAIYPDVFLQISYEELRISKCLVILDSIDECDVNKICAGYPFEALEDAIREIIKSSEYFHRIIFGRPHACDQVRRSLLKDRSLQDLEVMGFSPEQIKCYVDMFFASDQTKVESSWRKIRDTDFLLSMAYLPIFTKVLCHVFCENADVVIRTQTELNVSLLYVYLNQNLKGRLIDDIDMKDSEKLFMNNKVMDAIAGASKKAFEMVTSGKVSVDSKKDLRDTEVESGLETLFLVRQGKFLRFSHAILIDFLAAVHLFLTGHKVNSEILRNEHFRGILPMYFGLLGSLVKDSDSAKIIKSFTRPLINKFHITAIDKHPLCGKVGMDYRMGKRYLFMFTHLCHEFGNGFMLNDVDVYWDGDLSIHVDNAQQLTRLLFFMKNLRVRRRRIQRLEIVQSKRELTIDLWKQFSDVIISCGWKVDELDLLISSLNEEKMKILAPAICLVRVVRLWDIRVCSDESWMILLALIEDAVKSKTLQLEKLFLPPNINQSILAQMRKFVRDVFPPNVDA